MEAKAQARYVRVTPQKARRVVDLIRGRQAAEAIAVLEFAPQAASDPVRKVVQSAIANARVKADLASEAFDERLLMVQAAYVDEGPTLKRFRPRAQGRAYRIRKRTSHITVVVAPHEDIAELGTRPQTAARTAAPAPTTRRRPAAKASAAAGAAAPPSAGARKAVKASASKASDTEAKSTEVSAGGETAKKASAKKATASKQTSETSGRASGSKDASGSKERNL